MLSKNVNNKKVLLNSYYSMKKKSKRFLSFLTLKIDFESKILALFDSLPLLQFSKFGDFI